MDRPLDSATKTKVISQVEFYFSDSNAPRDKFLLEKIKGHPEGYVELAIICAFTRMQQHLRLPPGQKPEDIGTQIIVKVAEALKDSTELEVSKEGFHVRRRKPLESEEELVQEIDHRSVYAKPLPFDCTLEGLQEFFSSLGGIKAVRMRRRPENKDFKGSVFVEMDSPQMAAGLAEREDLVFEGAVLRIEKKMDYYHRKKQGRMTGGKNTKPPVEPAELGTQEIIVPPYDTGLVVQFIMLPEYEVPEPLNFNDIKKAFGDKEAGVIYVEYPKGGRQGYVRFTKLEFVKQAMAQADADGIRPLESVKAAVKVISDQEEKDFYRRQAVTRRNAEIERRLRDNGKRGFERGRGSGGRFGGKRGRIN